MEENRQLTTQLLGRQPGLFDALMMHQLRHGAPPFTGVPGVSWCTCGNYRNMLRGSEVDNREYCYKAC